MSVRTAQAFYVECDWCHRQTDMFRTEAEAETEAKFLGLVKEKNPPILHLCFLCRSDRLYIAYAGDEQDD